MRKVNNKGLLICIAKRPPADVDVDVDVDVNANVSSSRIIRHTLPS